MAKTPMTARRRISIATWKPPREGVIFGNLRLDATKALDYMAKLRENTGQKVTITSFMGAVTGRALAAEPTLNGRIHMGKYIPYDTVDLSYLVQLDGGKNLAQVKVEHADQLSPLEIAQLLQARAERVRSGGDKNFNKSLAMTEKMPTPILRRILSMGGFMTTGVGKAFAGQPAYPFGSAIITSIGMLGIDEACIPPTPWARVPLYVGIGKISDQVFAIDGKPEVRPGITIGATLDHRFVDGFQAGIVAKIVREAFDNPEMLGAIPPKSAQSIEPSAPAEPSESSTSEESEQPDA